MKNENDIAFIVNCGRYNRVVVREGDTYYIGCFTGTKDEAIAAISRRYSGVARDAYVAKIEELSTANLADFKDVTAGNNYAVRWAAENGDLATVKYLVSQGADITAYNNYAVRWASRNGHLEVVKYLVSQGADITADDNTAVRWASRNGHLEVVKYLESIIEEQRKMKEKINIIKYVRQHIGWSQYKLSKNAGVSTSNIHLIEKGGCNFTSIVKYMSVMGLELDDFGFDDKGNFSITFNKK